MKLLRYSPNASMSMSRSRDLAVLLPRVLDQNRVTTVLETGTYHGLGSTSMVASSFPRERPPALFVTIEANWQSWRIARENLRRFPFVTPLWGRTVNLDRAVEFIRNDDMLRRHEAYPDIYIDDVVDPQEFYINEMKGRHGSEDLSPLLRLRKLLDCGRYAGDDLLAVQLRRMKKDRPLIILDSAGGVGFLEFTTMLEEMGEYPYFLLLDDIKHIKHYRSYQHVLSDKSFECLGVNESEGWFLARHGGAGGAA